MRMNWKPSLAMITGMIFLASLLVAPVHSSPPKTPQYTPPDLSTAGEIAYPVATLAAGAVSVLLSLDTSAHIQNVMILRDFQPLTSSVQNAVQNWTFTPAMLNGQPVSSSLSVSVIFNIFNPAGGAAYQSLVLSPPQTPVPDASQYIPPQITMASFANYPQNSVSQGTVVLSVTVGKGGQPKKVRVVRGVQTLTQSAVNAVKTWSFNPATVQGQPVASQIIIAFVFQRNMG
jgi:TonB family protein